MTEILKDALLDTLKLIPLLFISYLLMEYAENKMDIANKKITENKFSIVIASLLGAVPQCGFSASASGFYAGGLISCGTLIAVYLSSSDEMLPILLSEGVPFKTIMQVLLIKIAAGIFFGYIIDCIVSMKKDQKQNTHEIHELCKTDHCHCHEKNIFYSAMVHTVNISVFIAVINIALNLILSYAGLDAPASLSLTKPFISEALFPLIGLIPNCASSIFITELYISEVINAPAMISGLLANSGVGLLVLFKQNKNLKENIIITFGLYFISVAVGVTLEIIGLTL